jgi:hypothetical protein
MNDVPYAVCAVVRSGVCCLSSGEVCYDGVSGSEGCVIVGVGGVRLISWNSGFLSATYCSLINNCCL